MQRGKTIAVIGGGSAGLTAARVACKQGANVLFFVGDKGDHSSLCIDAGCMPSKALFQPIDAMHHAKRNGWVKVEPAHPETYLAQIVAWKDQQIAGFRDYRQQQIHKLASESLQIINAKASFLNPHEVVSEGRYINSMPRSSRAARPRLFRKSRGSSFPGMAFGRAMRFCTTPESRGPWRLLAPAQSGQNFRCVTRG